MKICSHMICAYKCHLLSVSICKMLLPHRVWLYESPLPLSVKCFSMRLNEGKCLVDWGLRVYTSSYILSFLVSSRNIRIVYKHSGRIGRLLCNKYKTCWHMETSCVFVPSLSVLSLGQSGRKWLLCHATPRSRFCCPSFSTLFLSVRKKRVHTPGATLGGWCT